MVARVIAKLQLWNLGFCNTRPAAYCAPWMSDIDEQCYGYKPNRSPPLSEGAFQLTWPEQQWQDPVWQGQGPCPCHHGS